MTKEELLNKIAMALGHPIRKCQIGKDSVSTVIQQLEIEKINQAVNFAIAPFVVKTKYKLTGPHFFRKDIGKDPILVAWKVEV